MRSLAHRIVGEDGGGTLYVLHGFLGSGRNWSSIARHLVARRSDWQVVLADLRLHGDSRSRAGPHDINACAEDLRQLRSFRDRRDRPTVLLGHSFGGKVALAATRTLVPPPVQTWVIDSTPDPSSGEGSSTKMLDLVGQSPDAFASRDEAVAWIMDGGFDEPTARWMVMNLRRDGGQWAWQLDVPGLRDLLADFARSDLWSEVESAAETEIHFVHADRDSILSDEARARAERLEADGAAVRVTELPGGHWLHIDNPDGLLQLLVDHLPRV